MGLVWILLHFLCMGLSGPFQPAVSVLDESGDDLVQGSASFFFEGLNSKYFRLCGQYSLCHYYSALLL